MNLKCIMQSGRSETQRLKIYMGPSINGLEKRQYYRDREEFSNSQREIKRALIKGHSGWPWFVLYLDYGTGNMTVWISQSSQYCTFKGLNFTV